MTGRPTICTPELIEAAKAYVEGGWVECGDKVPSLVGLAIEIGVRRETLWHWAQDESHPFFNITKECMERQERALSNGGLGGDFQPTIAKLMLSKHGYSDSVDHRSGDGSMTPKPTEVIIRPADDASND